MIGHISAAILAIGIGSCAGSSDSPTPQTAGTGGVGGDNVAFPVIEEVTADGIKAFVAAEKYKDWYTDAAVHQDAGPHGKVKNFFNDLLRKSMTEGTAQHPKNSTVVKELYDASGTTLTGRAVDVRRNDEVGAQGWVFYEDFANTADSIDVYGIAHASCTSCHVQEKDFIRVSLP